MKKRFKIILVLIMLLIISAIGLLAYKKYLPQEEPFQAKEIMDQITDYGYTLDSFDSSAFKEEFVMLTEVLNNEETDYEAYAKSLAKLFAIDLYTIETKLNKSDVGGVEYIYSTKAEVYKQKMMDTMYKEVKDNTQEKRNQELPFVSKVEVEGLDLDKYDLDKKEVDSYKVVVSLKYKIDMGYDQKIKIILVREDKKLSIVEFEPFNDIIDE